MSRGVCLISMCLALACGQAENVPPAMSASTAGAVEVPTAAPPEPTVQADRVKLVARGKVVYAEQKCQACHSIDGAGNRRNPLDGVGDRLDETAIRTWIVAPRQMNPRVTKRAFDRIPPADLDALVAYLKSLRQTS